MASTLQMRIREAKEQGIRWSVEEIAAAEEAAERMFAEPDKRNEILELMVRKEGKNF